jgi:cilia- and flagella-associated protein 52
MTAAQKSALYGNGNRGPSSGASAGGPYPGSAQSSGSHAKGSAEQSLLELEHSIGYNARFTDTLKYHPTDKDTLVYPIGGLLVIENRDDKSKQQFLRGHDMEISALAISNSGKLMATGQRGTIFQKTPEAPIILWSYETKKPLAVLKGMSECVNKLAFSPDDQFLCGTSANNMFCIWSVRDGNPIHTRFFEQPMTLATWGDIHTKENPKHPAYTLITGNQNSMFVNRLEFDIASMTYSLKTNPCQLPNTGLVRNYNFAAVNGDMLIAGTTGGDICVFSVYN